MGVCLFMMLPMKSQLSNCVNGEFIHTVKWWWWWYINIFFSESGGMNYLKEYLVC